MGSEESVEQICSLRVKGVCDATCPDLQHIHECVLSSRFCKAFPYGVQAMIPQTSISNIRVVFKNGKHGLNQWHFNGLGKTVGLIS